MDSLFESSGGIHHYAVPLETVHTYTERVELSAELEQKLQIRHERASIPHAVTLYGLGGAGKSQLALCYAEKHKTDTSMSSGSTRQTRKRCDPALDDVLWS